MENTSWIKRADRIEQLKKAIGAALSAVIISIGCAPPPTPQGYEGIEYTCQVMLAVLMQEGAVYDELDTWLRIGRRESNCLLHAEAHDSDDDSYCWFQINYKGSLRASRTETLGPEHLLVVDAAMCARAALILRLRSGFSPWGF